MMQKISNICEDSIVLECNGRKLRVSLSLMKQTADAMLTAFINGMPADACVPAVFDMVVDDVKELISITAKLEDEQ